MNKKLKGTDWIGLILALGLGTLAGGAMRKMGYGPVTVAVVILLAGLLCIVVLKIIRTLIWKRKNGPFIKAYNHVVREHQSREPKNYQAFYDGLIAIKEEPQSVESKAAYILSLSSAKFFIGDEKGALELLDEVPLYNDEVRSVVAQQKEHIRNRSLK